MPNITTEQLKKAFTLTDAQASQIVELLYGEVPDDAEGYRDNFPHEWRLEQINPLINGSGVEGLTTEGAISPIAEYINTGDTYSATILWDIEAEQFSLTCWGDFYEAWEAEQETDDDEEKGDDVCDCCMTSEVHVDRTTYCGKTIGIECGCDESSDGTCGDDDCEACANKESDDD